MGAERFLEMWSDLTPHFPAQVLRVVSHQSSSRSILTPHTIDWIQITLFGIVDALTLHQISRVVSLRSTGTSLTGGKSRTFFIFLLFLANLARALAILMMLYSSRLSEWSQILIETAPTLLFLSTYTVVILFWSQVYYAAILVAVPLLRPTFVFLSMVSYLIYAVVAVVTYWMKAPEDFRQDLQFLYGLLFCFVGFGIFYYGMKVVEQLVEDRSRIRSRKSSILRRIVTLALVCPVIFSVRGAYSLAAGFNLVSEGYPTAVEAPLWTAMVNLVSEWVPSVLILATFWNRKPPNIATQEPSEPSWEAPLMHHNYYGRTVMPQNVDPASSDRELLPSNITEPLFAQPVAV